MIYTEEEFEKETKDLVLVDFHATWCAPCRELEPVLDKITDIKIIKIDVDKNKYLAYKNTVMSVPTLIIFKDNNEISRKVSYQSYEELMTWINNYK